MSVFVTSCQQQRQKDVSLAGSRGDRGFSPRWACGSAPFPRAHGAQRPTVQPARNLAGASLPSQFKPLYTLMVIFTRNEINSVTLFQNFEILLKRHMKTSNELLCHFYFRFCFKEILPPEDYTMNKILVALTCDSSI